MSRFPLSSTPIAQHAPKPLNFRLSRTFVLHSPSAGTIEDSLLIGINDDEAEKKELRQQRFRKSLAEIPRIHLSEERISSEIIEQLSKAKREEHFQLCMKLSAENKISEKNAFRLHLIEYLTEMVKARNRTEMSPNFQMASITLHASAKLYAVKVDCLHYITVKMANKMSDPVTRSTDATQAKKKPGSEGEDADGDDYNEGTHRRQKRTGRRRKVNYVAEDMSAIDWGYVNEIITEITKPHAKYDLVTSVFEDGKCGGLMSHLRMHSDAKGMILAETVPYISEKEALKVAEATVPENVKCLMTAADGEAEISKTLSLFSFHDLRWPLDESTPLEEEERGNVRYIKTLSFMDLFESQHLIGQVSLPSTGNITAVSGPDLHSRTFEGIHEDLIEVEEKDDKEDTPKEMHKQSQTLMEGKEGNSYIYKKISTRRQSAIFSNVRYDPPHLPQIEFSMVDVTAYLLSSEPIEYSPFDSKLQAIFLGKQAFRAKGLPSHPEEINDPTGTSEVEKKKKSDVLQFTFEKQELASVRSKIQHGKQSTYTARYPEEWKEDSITWPTWACEDSVLNSTFLKPTFSVEEGGDKVQINMTMDYEADMDYESCASFYGEGVGSEIDNSGFCLFTSFNRENVLLKPRKSGQGDYQDEEIMKNDIPYATTAKQVDQQTVKKVLWSVITEDPDNIGNIEGRVKEGFEENDFCCVYAKVKHGLPEPMNKDISIPIAFVVLLQLANEHALQLKPSSDLKHLIIRRPMNRPPPA